MDIDPQSETDLDAVALLAQERNWNRASVLLGPDFAVRWASPSVNLLTGWSVSQLIGMTAFELIHEEDAQAAAEILAFEVVHDVSVRVGVRQRSVREMRVRDPNGDFLVLEVSLTNYLSDPDIQMIWLELAAPTQFRFADQALELTRIGGDLGEILSLAMTQFTFGGANQPAGAIFGSDGEVLAATDNAPQPFGQSEPALFPCRWEIPLHEFAQSESVGLAHFWTQEPSPHPFDLETSIRVARHAEIAIGRNRANRLLYEAAHNDPLTGIANRRALEHDLQARLDRSDEVTLAYLDLDGFKAINDEHGHAAGDHVLRIVAERLRSVLRQGDVAARIGGDEFVLLLGSPPPMIDALRTRLRQAIQAPITYNEHVVHISASIGFGSSEPDAEALMRVADRAMLEEKTVRRPSRA